MGVCVWAMGTGGLGWVFNSGAHGWGLGDGCV